MLKDEDSASLQGTGGRYASRNRFSMLAGISLSLLIHALVFWFLFHQTQLLEKPLFTPDEGRLTISLAPSMPRQNTRETPDSSQMKPAAPSIERKPHKKPTIAKKQAPISIAKITPESPRQETETHEVSPSDDMFTQLEARRKRRAEAHAQAGLPEQAPSTSSSEKEKNDNNIALANIAASLKRANQEDQSESGGVFQIRHVGYRNAQVFFRGWSTSARRDRTRLIDIEQGPETDIQTAVVKKMMEIIREERQGDFIWDSHRLGKQLTLSARPQDRAELQQFLMKEFFPDYLPGNNRR